MLKNLGGVMYLEDGTKADVIPLREDRGALWSLALLVVSSLALLGYNLLSL